MVERPNLCLQNVPQGSSNKGPVFRAWNSQDLLNVPTHPMTTWQKCWRQMSQCILSLIVLPQGQVRLPASVLAKSWCWITSTSRSRTWKGKTNVKSVMNFSCIRHLPGALWLAIWCRHALSGTWKNGTGISLITFSCHRLQDSANLPWSKSSGQTEQPGSRWPKRSLPWGARAMDPCHWTER